MTFKNVERLWMRVKNVDLIAKAESLEMQSEKTNALVHDRIGQAQLATWGAKLFISEQKRNDLLKVIEVISDTHTSSAELRQTRDRHGLGRAGGFDRT